MGWESLQVCNLWRMSTQLGQRRALKITPSLDHISLAHRNLGLNLRQWACLLPVTFACLKGQHGRSKVVHLRCQWDECTCVRCSGPYNEVVCWVATLWPPPPICGIGSTPPLSVLITATRGCHTCMQINQQIGRRTHIHAYTHFLIQTHTCTHVHIRPAQFNRGHLWHKEGSGGMEGKKRPSWDLALPPICSSKAAHRTAAYLPSNPPHSPTHLYNLLFSYCHATDDTHSSIWLCSAKGLLREEHCL